MAQPREAEAEQEEKSKIKRFWDRLSTFFVKNFLPISFIFAVVFGALVPGPGVFFNHKETVYVCISILFCYVGLYLRTSAIKVGLKAYKAYIWSILMISLFTCVIGGLLTNLLNFGEPGVTNSGMNTNTSNGNLSSSVLDLAVENTLGPFECKVGLILYLIMPCTVGSGVIMIMDVKGHAALGILITVVCNIVGIFTIPLYMEWLVFSNINVKFDIAKLMLKLFLTLFIPLAIGKCLRFVTRIRRTISIPSRKNKLKMFAFSALAFVLLIKTSQSSQDGSLKELTGKTAAVICFWALAMHLLFIVINTIAVFILRLENDQKKTVVILASQKTLTQAVAASVFLDSVGDVGVVAVTMVFCHLTILIFDSVMITVWIHIEENLSRKKKGEEEDNNERLCVDLEEQV